MGYFPLYRVFPGNWCFVFLLQFQGLNPGPCMCEQSILLLSEIPATKPLKTGLYFRLASNLCSFSQRLVLQLYATTPIKSSFLFLRESHLFQTVVDLSMQLGMSVHLDPSAFKNKQTNIKQQGFPMQAQLVWNLLSRASWAGLELSDPAILTFQVLGCL